MDFLHRHLRPKPNTGTDFPDIPSEDNHASHLLGKNFWQCYASKKARYLERFLTSSTVYSLFQLHFIIIGFDDEIVASRLPIDAMPCCKYRFAIQPG